MKKQIKEAITTVVAYLAAWTLLTSITTVFFFKHELKTGAKTSWEQYNFFDHHWVMLDIAALMVLIYMGNRKTKEDRDRKIGE